VVLREDGSGIAAMALAEGGGPSPLVALGTADGWTSLCDAGSGARVADFAKHGRGVTALAHLPAQRALVAGHKDGMLHWYGMQELSGTCTPVRSLSGAVTCLLSIPDVSSSDSSDGGSPARRPVVGNSAAVASDASAAEEDYFAAAEQHSFSPTSAADCSSPRPRHAHAGLPPLLACGTWVGHVLLWDAQTRQLLGHLPRQHTRSVQSLVSLPDGRLAVGGADGLLRLWRIGLPTLKGCVCEQEVMAHPQGGIHHMLLLPTGVLLTAGSDGAIAAWVPRPQRSDGCDGAAPAGSSADVHAYDGSRRRASSSSSNSRACSGATPTQRSALYVLAHVTRTRSPIFRMAALPDGRLAVAYIAAPDIDLFAPSLRETGAFSVGTGHDGRLNRNVGEVGFPGDSGAAAVPAGSSVHAGSAEVGELPAAGAHTGYAATAHELPGLPRTSTGHSVSAGILGAAEPVFAATAAAAAPKACVAADGAPLLDGPGYTLQRTLRGHHDSVFDLLVLPGGQLLSASKDRTVRRWDLGASAADAVEAVPDGGTGGEACAEFEAQT
jgi:WD40 repeat protein